MFANIVNTAMPYHTCSPIDCAETQNWAQPKTDMYVVERPLPSPLQTSSQPFRFPSVVGQPGPVEKHNLQCTHHTPCQLANVALGTLQPFPSHLFAIITCSAPIPQFVSADRRCHSAFRGQWHRDEDLGCCCGRSCPAHNTIVALLA